MKLNLTQRLIPSILGRLLQGHDPKFSPQRGSKLEVGKAFGEVLRLARKRAGLTQEQLGHAAGVQRKYVSLLEMGTHEPSLGTLLRISLALNCTATSLVLQVEERLSSENPLKRE